MKTSCHDGFVKFNIRGVFFSWINQPNMRVAYLIATGTFLRHTDWSYVTNITLTQLPWDGYPVTSQACLCRQSCTVQWNGEDDEQNWEFQIGHESSLHCRWWCYPRNWVGLLYEILKKKHSIYVNVRIKSQCTTQRTGFVIILNNIGAFKRSWKLKLLFSW